MLEREQAVEQLNENSRDWISSILQDGGEGFGEVIVDFDPVPSEENNWLWDEEGQMYSGKIMDDRSNAYEFKILKEGDNWSTSTKMISGEIDEVEDGDTEVVEGQAGEPEVTIEADEVLIDNEEKEEMAEVDKTVMGEDDRCWDGYEPVPGKKKGEKGSCREIKEEMSESEDLKQEMAELRKELAMYKEAKLTEAKENINEFCEGLYEDGRLTEGVFPKKTLKIIMEGLISSDMSSPMMYSEGGEDKSTVKSLKTLLSSIPKQVEFNEALTRGIEPQLVNKVPKMYGSVSEEGAKEYNQIMKYKEDNSISTFAEARRKMYRELG